MNTSERHGLLSLNLATCLLAALGPLGATGCASSGSTDTPGWTRTTLESGLGAFDLGVRFRWVAVRDKAGVVVKTPEGGSATVRVFQCGASLAQLKKLLRQRLRGRLIGGELAQTDSKRVVAWRWRSRGPNAKNYGTAVQRHGPLLIAVISENIALEDLSILASQVRLSLPVPSIPGCFPICMERDPPCEMQNPEAE